MEGRARADHVAPAINSKLRSRREGEEIDDTRSDVETHVNVIRGISVK
jgi:hypothetical protein